jgi:hypothetical protein
MKRRWLTEHRRGHPELSATSVPLGRNSLRVARASDFDKGRMEMFAAATVASS